MYTEEPSVRVFNPAFVAAVHEKRRREVERQKRSEIEAERAALVEARIAEIARKAREREMLKEAAEEQRKAERQREMARDLELPKSPFRRIEDRACAVFDVLRKELYSDRKNNEVVAARQFVYYWAARLIGLSYPEIGRRMGRDHTTILYGKDAYIAKRAKMGRNLRGVR